LAYANGPLTVRYADLHTNQDAGWANGSTTAVTAGNGAQFNLKTLSAKYAVNSAVTVGYFHQAVSSDAITTGSTSATNKIFTTVYDRKTDGISASFLATPKLTLLGNYAKVKVGANEAWSSNISNASVVATVAGATTTVVGLGADYALSKRTVAYFRTERDQDDAIVRAVTGYGTNAAGTYKATAVGIRHAF